MDTSNNSSSGRFTSSSSRAPPLSPRGSGSSFQRGMVGGGAGSPAIAAPPLLLLHHHHHHHHGAVAPHVAAANSLQLLLAEDPALLTLISSSSSSPKTPEGDAGGSASATAAPSSADRQAFAYAARLLELESDGSSASGSGRSARTASSKERADLALQDVERKLALVESLAVKLSRTRPEAVAGQFLRLHGYGHFDDNGAGAGDEDGDGKSAKEGRASIGELEGASGPAVTDKSDAATLTLAQIRDRADRLERQAGVLDGVAHRVESSLVRGYDKLQATCARLENVLETSSTLKSLLRLTFEATKLLGYDVDDLRDLTRAAVSTAVVEELLAELPAGISVVEDLRPQLLAKGRQVRQAAADLLRQYQAGSGDGDGDSNYNTIHGNSFADGVATPLPLSQLGSILQVYYSLGELPDAVWRSIEQSHHQAEQATRVLLQGSTSGSKASDLKKRRQARAEAAAAWGSSLTAICLSVWNLQRVLQSKTDPTTRDGFLTVVQAAPVPFTYQPYVQKKSSNSIWTLFWCRYCASLSSLLSNATRGLDPNSSAIDDIAALYPNFRSAAMELIGRLQETPAWEDLLSSSARGGIHGTGGGASTHAGSLGGGRLDDPFLEWTSTTSPSASQSYENPQAASSSTSSAQTSGAPSLSADVWTRPSGPEAIHRSTWLGSVPSTAAYSASAVLNSPEWKTLQAVGLFPLQQAFLHSCRKRLYEPLQYMFPVEQAVTIEDGGAAAAAASGMVMLPSKYDIQRFDEHIRQELSLADPRKEGGGDLTLVGMIADCVCDMIAVFCERAMTAVTGGEEASLVQDNWNMSDGVQHDRKVAAILHATAKYLKNAGDKTFVSPYRPSVSPQHEEAARICQAGLEPALAEIERMVKNVILYPVCRSANRRILDVLAKMHHGVYIDGDDVAAPSFVQKYLAMALERIGQNVLARFPPEYASIMSSRVASFTILAFCSNASLLRPLGENARLHVTQDLADLELALDQLVLKNGGTQSLGQVVGKPYAELRAMRQMLFWTGLENSGATAQNVAKSLLREPWILDVRPSTVLHYLFSFAPKLLSSPHHSKKLMARDYVATLVSYVGLVADGEDGSWMTTMACCDSYQQRASSVAVDDGDARVPQIILLVGQELMRRKQSVTNLR